MSSNEEPQSIVNLRVRIQEAETENAAVARLKGLLSLAASPDQAITSYDRMHHRHNRS
jgi:hypothetical protein